MKRELNIDNMVYIINQQEKFTFTTNNLKRYRTYITNIIDYFYNEITYNDIENGDKVAHGGFLKLNDEFINKELYNIKRIEFINFYPNAILKLSELGFIKFSSNEFKLLYYFLLKNKYNMRKHKDFNEHTRQICNFILNYLFGFSINNNINYSIDKPSLVVHHTRGINEKIDNLYNPIYIDTDRIYINEIDDNLIKLLDNTNLPYVISDNINALFLRPKQYITERDGVFKENGFGILQKSKTRYKNYKEIIDKFEENTKVFNRNKKIKKLLTKIK